VSRLFTAYVMVDWSAAAKPAAGKDSIWIGVFKKDVRFRLAFEAHNPTTRAEAMAQIRAVLKELKRKGERTLLGFDFPLGFPRGTAGALNLKQPDWSGLWAFLAKDLVDKPNNTNNRFAVANKMNRLMTDKDLPFWGCPPKDAQTWLSVKRPDGWPGALTAMRHAEDVCTAKSVWQLFGAGSVGGQALTGIPHLKALADDLGETARVWPFQTSWKSLGADDLEGADVLIAEVYPSLVEAKPEPGEIADRAQVRALCEHLARLDETGKLAAAFGPKSGQAKFREVVEAEEGWILGC
jgi:hypothetical protein